MAAPHHAHDHDFFVPPPSIWPPLNCLGVGMLAFGIIGTLHFEPKILWHALLAAGVLILLLGAIQWFRTLVKESRLRGFTAVPKVLDLANRYGMIFFIASEIMFFAAFFAAYFYVRGHNPEWPPANIATLPLQLPLLGTLLLLSSGATITWAHHNILTGRRPDAILATFLTWQLGVMFTALQAYEYTHAEFSFSDGIFASIFFMLTGFHGFHVIIGSLMLMVLHRRLTGGDFTRREHFYFEAAAWYWHFVDVVWIGLFLFVYVL